QARAGFPDNVEDDILISGVLVVPMRVPAVGREVHFHVPVARQAISELDNRVAKIGPGLMVPKTGMQHTDGLTVRGDEPIAPQSLVMPDQLENLFGEWGAIGTLGQSVSGPILRAPPLVEIG